MTSPQQYPNRFVQRRAFSYFRVENPRHKLVQDEAEFWQVIRFLEKQKTIGLDYETSGLQVHRHSRICGVALGCETANDVYAWYVPFRHVTGERQLPEDVVLKGTKILTEKLDLEKICHNVKFEDHMSRRDGMQLLGPRRDTMIEAHLYDENQSAALKNRAATDLGNMLAHKHEALLNRELARLAKEQRLKITEYKDAFGYSQVPVGLAAAYACYDIEFTLQLARFYDHHSVRAHFQNVYETEIRLASVLCDMERNGVPVDVGYIQGLKERVSIACERLAPKIYQAVGNYHFNIASDDELRHVLITRCGLPLTKKTKAEKLSVDVEVLESFSDMHPVCDLLLEYRTADKIRTTYTDSILKRIGWDGLLHGEFRALGTNTGRLASSNPNMQNFPSDSDSRAQASTGKKIKDGGVDPFSIKRAFVRRGDDQIRLHYDYSQIELRVLAEYSQDPTMLDVYRNGLDIHTRTESEVFGTEDGTNRRPAKVINFGLCVAEGQLVLTDHGEIPIERVLSHHKVWDGIAWVSHSGIVCRGEQEVITYDGLTATPDHEVYTTEGKRIPLACLQGRSDLRGQLAIGGRGTIPITYTDFDRRRKGAGDWDEQDSESCGSCVHCLRKAEVGAGDEYSLREEYELPVSVWEILRSPGEVFGAAVRRYDATLLPRHTPFFPPLQRAGHQGFVHVTRTLHPVGVGYVSRSGFSKEGLRPHRQRRALLAGQPSLGGSQHKSAKQAAVVYDILNAGPRRRFTVSGKVVSNSYCLSAKGFSRQAKMQLEKAEAYMQRFFARYPRIAPFREEFWAMCRRNQNSFLNKFGRPRRIPGLALMDGYERGRAERQAIGSLIQGTAAELTKASLIRIADWEQKNGAGIKLLSTIHDEISMDLPMANLREVSPEIKGMMEDFAPYFPSVPIVTDTEFSLRSWDEKRTLTSEVINECCP